MRAQFPPGDMNWKSMRDPSAWREFNFAYNQVKSAIVPHLSLETMIEGWEEISKLLSESHRERKLQLSQPLFHLKGVETS